MTQTNDKVMGGYFEPQLEQTLFTLLKGRAGGAKTSRNPKSSHLPCLKDSAGLFQWPGLRVLKFKRPVK